MNDVSRYKGMTTNEALYTAGLMEAFDDALKVGDRERGLEILKRVRPPMEAANIVAAIFTQAGWPPTPLMKKE